MVAISSSVIYVISWIDFNDLSPHYGSYFPAFCILCRFWLEVRHYEFYFVGCRYLFLYSTNILQLFSRIHLSYLEMFHVLLIFF